MKILMTGATGLIGQALGQKLSQLGHELVVVTRHASRARETLSFKAELVECDLNQNQLHQTNFNGVGAIIHLAGESIDGRWSQEKKQQILNSRTIVTENLLAQCPTQMGAIISASAQGFYGDRGNEELNEESAKGEGFLAEVCSAWESSLQKASCQRTVIFRIGLVLSRKGGALKKLVGLFQKNLGAVLGSGDQWMSAISLTDLVRLFVEALENKNYHGIYNAVNNQPVTNRDFTQTLAKELAVMTLPSAPSWVLKIVLGEMSNLILSSLKVKSTRLAESGFQFLDHNLEDFLKNELAPHKNGASLFEAEQFIPAPIEKVFAFFAEAENLEKITPDFLNFKIVKMSTSKIEAGSLIDYRLKVHGVPVGWKTEIRKWDPPHEFIDFQLKGPYQLWHHVHRFKTVTGGTLMTDEVTYKLPVGLVGRLVGGAFVESDVTNIFKFRRQFIARNQF